MSIIKPCLKFFLTQRDTNNIGALLDNRENVLLADLTTATWRKYVNPGYNLEIGEEKYTYSLLGKTKLDKINFN